jgi:hypothetical protein
MGIRQGMQRWTQSVEAANISHPKNFQVWEFRINVIV